MWYSYRVIPSNWIMTVSLDRNGNMYSAYTLIDKRRMKSSRFNSDKHCLPKPVANKLAMVKLMQGSYDVSIIGAWLGDRIMAVALDKDEYKKLLGMTYGDTGEQGQEGSESDAGLVSEGIQNDTDDRRLREVRSA